MSIDMKKLAALSLSVYVFFSLALPTFAQPVDVDPCPTESGFNKLCDNFGPEQGTRIIGQVLNILLIAAVVLALFFLIYGGIRWILSGGDKAKVETARQTIVAAIIGLIVAFLAYFIVNIILSVFGLGSINDLAIPRIGK